MADETKTQAPKAQSRAKRDTLLLLGVFGALVPVGWFHNRYADSAVNSAGNGGGTASAQTSNPIRANHIDTSRSAYQFAVIQTKSRAPPDSLIAAFETVLRRLEQKCKQTRSSAPSLGD